MTFFLIVLGIPAAAYRLTRLITKDTFPPVLWLRDRLAGGWRPLTEQEWRWLRDPKIDTAWMRKGAVPGPDGTEVTGRWVERAAWSPYWLAELLSCPWCASAYMSALVAVYGGCLGWYSWPVAVIVWFYAWAVAAVVASKGWA